MKSSQAVISRIQKLSNPDWFSVEIRQENESIVIGALVNVVSEKRVAWKTVPRQLLEMADITDFSTYSENGREYLNQGKNMLASKLFQQEVKIVYNESTTPTVITTGPAAGKFAGQPKRNPQTGEVLTKDGLPLYRVSDITTDLTVADVRVTHDGKMSFEDYNEQYEDYLTRPLVAINAPLLQMAQ